VNVGNVVDFSPLAGKLKLEYLRVKGGKGKDLSFLKTLTNLREFYLSGNKFNYIPDLSELKKVESASLSSTEISKITGLGGLSDLKHLELRNNKYLTKIEGLEDLVNLNSLDLTGSAIKRMENLNLPKLGSLNISRTDITKMENMSGMPNLYYLEIYDTKIEKIEGYLEAPSLTNVETDYTYEFSKNNEEAIKFLSKRRKSAYGFLTE
jgi:Leucine-rich repeat (LRR) protein